MRKFKLLIALAAILVIGYTSVVRAEFALQTEPGSAEGNNLNTVICYDRVDGAGGCNNLIPGPVWVKGWKVLTESATARAALFDATSVPADASTDAKDELFEVTAGEVAAHFWTSPIKFENGVSIGTSQTTGLTVIVFY